MKKLDLAKVPLKAGSIYPPPYAEQMEGRSSLRLGQAAGLTQFGVNLVTLKPGALSSLRHWHQAEDEFVLMISGECVMVTDDGEEIMRQGDCAGFPANTPDGHHFINRGDTPAVFLVVGAKAREEVVTCSDVDLVLTLKDGIATYTHKDGRPYAPEGEDHG
ncbi:cupin domain-containing protein [Pseudogemmobacter faecipullorum]|uniref:Cupin domain-containing protein n=1 Tax=Pseudogemmobacter faecipullorum TaxID=2755041 RepID=A0ABS8CI03_9RHOB|nr:cupin domain-containing protein [Pseudogemmobacter faecipullorum]MCB5409013.1 cupin domain-containing protein [Pseudogemmobacter faecipullorum]